MVAGVTAASYGPPMARTTNHVVQAYVAGRGNGLKAEQPVLCKSADDAIRMAEKIAPTKQGVVALSTSGDEETGDYDERPIILFKSGRVPPQFDG